MIGLNKIGLNQVQLNQLYLNTLCACQKSSGGDGFPRLRGDVTRWSFKGLTNEQMSKSPRLEDADHKGRFLTFKNFAWSEMSGVGGYTTSREVYAFAPNTCYLMVASSVQKRIQFVFKVTGLKSGNNLYLQDVSSPSNVYGKWTKDGIYTVDADIVDSNVYFYNGIGATRGTFTIEILPYYPGFIIGDGVDDYAVSEKDLDFEDTYTVYTAFIPFQEDPARNMLLCGKAYTKDFYVRYKDLKNLRYYSAGTRAIVKFSNGFNLIACKRTPTQMVAKNLLTGETIVADANSLVENPGLYYLWTASSKMEYAKAAIAGQVICNGHFTSDEEDTKVLNWYKKEYPWLFFDQAWTVVGKSNEDTDRATIANITGNGNNLVLSNFGFAGNSGYGEYAYNWSNISEWNAYSNNATFELTSSTIHITEVKSARPFLERKSNTGGYNKMKIKVTDIKTGEILRFASDLDPNNAIIIETDGNYSLPGSSTEYYGFRLSNSANTYPFNCDITIEQIPDHEGYLVTDGVDDWIASPNFTLGKKFTVVGEWKLLDKGTVPAGFVKPVDFYLYPHTNGLSFHCKRGSNATLFNNIKSLVAFNSEGVAYDHSWQKYVDTKVGDANPNHSSMTIGTGNNTFAKVAFKNMAMYAEKVLSKEDMIKAYIYLQTLKAK